MYKKNSETYTQTPLNYFIKTKGETNHLKWSKIMNKNKINTKYQYDQLAKQS